MLAQIRPALLMTIVLVALTGLIYPLGLTAVTQVLFHGKANGSLVSRNGAVVGSALIGQGFAGLAYFHPRPSAAGSNGYDATASGGSNLGPTNPDLAKRLAKDAAAYRSDNGVTGPLPADAVTASASGLDPDISPANAMLQVNRIAKARKATAAQLTALVQGNTEGRQLGIFGEPRVNVLKLNLALDSQFPSR
jgi:potassium-transporting ATPase KdpC subunit